MHPYRLIPRVLMQAQYLKNKPLIQAVHEFSAYVSQLFLYHLFDEDEEDNKQLMIVLASISFYRQLQASMFQTIPECDINANRALDDLRYSIVQEYGKADLHRELVYQAHYFNVYLFCQYLMYKAINQHLKEDFQSILETELTAFVVKEFGLVPWTLAEIFSCILMVMALLLVIASTLLLIPSMTQWVAGQYAIQAVSLIVSGVCGLFLGGFMLTYTCCLKRSW